jgi:hypothetical protein
MKPNANSDVRWEMVSTDKTDPAMIWAGFYLLLTFAPLAGAILNARREKGGRAQS